MKRLVRSALFCASLLGSNLASAEILSPLNDTFVRSDGSGPYGSNPTIALKTSGSSTTRKGYIDFIVNNPQTISDAKLSLTVAYFNNGTQATFNVWGVDPGCNDLFISEATAIYSSFIYRAIQILGNSSNEVINNDCIANNAQPLGTFTVQSSQLNSTIDFQSDALTNFLKNNHTEKSGFIITRTAADGGSMNTDFASKENTSLPGPKLQITRIAYDPAGTNLIPEDDTYVRYNGTGPYGSAQDIYVRSASVQENVHKGFLEFNVPNFSSVDSAKLELTVSKFNPSDPVSTFNVWGMSDSGIFAKHSGKAMDVYSYSQENSGKVVQWNFHNNENQKFIFTPNADGYYEIRVKHSNKCLDLEGANNNNGARLYQWDCHGGTNQQFKLESAGPNYYYIKPRHSNKCLDVSGYSMNEGASIYQWDCLGNDNQKWQINSLCRTPNQAQESLISTTTMPTHPLTKNVMDEWNTSYGICSYGGPQGGPIATFTVSASDLNKTITISSAALTNYVKRIGNKSSFVITRQNSAGGFPAFASKENTSLQGPRLVLSKIDVPMFEDWSGNATENADGSWHFEGDMEIPYTGGGLMLCSGVSADISFDANGQISTFSGTMSSPSIQLQDGDDFDMFSQLGSIGGFSQNDTTYEIGYDYPSAFDNAELPLDANKKYFYFVQISAGESAGWGNISFSSGGNTSLFALDPNTPALWTYTDAIGEITEYVNYIAFGISNEHNISFTPLTEKFVEPYINSFNGNMYIATSVNIPSPVPSVDFVIDGAATVDTDGELLSAGSSNAFRQMGINGKLGLSTGLGPFSLSIDDMAEATVVINKENSPYVAFSGTVTPTNFSGLPSFFNVEGTIAGYFDGNSNDNKPSYVKLYGETKFGGKFSDQGLELSTYISENGASISGKAKFGPTTVNVSGNVYSSYAKFTGSLSNNFNIGSGTSISLHTSVGFDTRNTTVSFSSSASVSYCLDYFFGEECFNESVSTGDISTSLGNLDQIRVCIDLPNVIPGPDHPCFDL